MELPGPIFQQVRGEQIDTFVNHVDPLSEN